MHSRQDPTATIEETGDPGSALSGARRIAEALAAVHRSLATCQFYPPNHPLLQDAVKDGYRAWATIECDPRLSETGLKLRNGALWLGDDRIGDGNPAVLNLARTLAAHGVARVLCKAPLTQDGFSQWVALLATAQDALRSRGGIEGVWRTTPFADALELQQLTVTANAREERALEPSSARLGGWGQGLEAGRDIGAVTDSLVFSRLKTFQTRGPTERRLLDLLLRLGRAEHITQFLELLKEIARLTQEYVGAERYREAFHVTLFLYREAQNMDALAKEGRRDYLLDTLRLLLRGGFLQWLIDFVAKEGGHEEAEIGEFILRAVGKPAVVPLVNALVLQRERLGRKRIIDVLVAIGNPVVPVVVKMLDDQRWFVVRNMVTILGGVSSPESLKALSRLAADPDSRIRREVVRAVARARGPLAAQLLLSLLDDRDPAVRLMAVAAAPTQRTPEVLEALWRMYREMGIRVPEWNLKAQILQTVGRLGMPEAADRLEEVLAKRHFFWRKRWETVHVSALQALGELGGQRARVLLEKFLDHGSAEIRRATIRALATCGDETALEDLCEDD